MRRGPEQEWSLSVSYPLILMRIQRDSSDPLEAGQGSHPGRVLFQDLQGGDQLLLPRVHAAKYPIAKPFLAHLVPDVFDRIELRAPGRQKYQAHRGRHLQPLGLVPARSVEHHENQLARMTTAYFG